MSGHSNLLAALGAALSTSLVAGCSGPPGEPCNAGNQCLLNSYCLLSRCVSATAISQNLSVRATPTDSSIPPQSFLPRQYQTVDGFSTLMLGAAQTITGPIDLPENCPGDAGYPIELDFTAPSLIPGIPEIFQFFSDNSGNLDATLPQGSYAARISTAMACAAPILSNDLVFSATPFQFSTFPAPVVSSGDQPTGDAIRPSLNITGVVEVPLASTLYQPVVRILAPSEAGPIAGTVLSGDQTLVRLSDGGLGIGLTFVTGGPAALPVQPLPGGGIIQTPVPINGIEVKSTICQQASDAGTSDGGFAHCDHFVVEFGPSRAEPELPTIDVPVVAQETDQGAAGAAVSVDIQLAFNPVNTFAVSIRAQGLDAGQALTSTPISISTMDGGITACEDPDAGMICRLNASTISNGNTGTASFDVVPGRYALTLQPAPPLGASVTMIDVLNGGQVAPVFAAQANKVIRAPDGGQLVILTPVAPISVQGTVHEVSSDGPLLPAGEVRLLTLPGMALVAQQALSAGTFSMQAAPGQYILLIEPDATTRFPTYYTDLTAAASPLAHAISYVVPAPRVLAGVVQQTIDGGVFPVPSYLQFFYVATDGAGDTIAVPVATALTDRLGRWSTAGPPGE